jgi:sugar lactone lactonase YvrE
VSLSPLGEIREIARDGKQSTVATLSQPGQGFGPVGLALDGRGDLFAADATFDPTTNGVYEISNGGTVTRLPGSDQIGLPNGLAFDDRGALYATDSVNGAVWRIAPDRPAVKWVQSPLLAGNGSFGFGIPIGANGIAFRHDSLYVAVSELGRVARIPLSSSGAAGPLQVVAEGPQLIGADGCQFDVHSNLYVALSVRNGLVQVAPGGAVTVIATAADGLDFPASPLFGVGHGDRTTLFVTNFAIGHANPADAHPGVLAFAIAIPGQPLPNGEAFNRGR